MAKVKAGDSDAGHPEHPQEKPDPMNERAVEKKRPWYGRSTEILSCLAIAVASASIGLSLWSDQEQSAGEERRHLSSIFSEIGAANAEMAKIMALPLPIATKGICRICVNQPDLDAS